MTGSCTAVTEPCGGFMCGAGGKCLTSCAGDGDCVTATHYCSVDDNVGVSVGVCVPRKVQGNMCTVDSECGTGLHCVENVCCGSATCSQCQSCARNYARPSEFARDLHARRRRHDRPLGHVHGRRQHRLRQDRQVRLVRRVRLQGRVGDVRRRELLERGDEPADVDALLRRRGQLRLRHRHRLRRLRVRLAAMPPPASRRAATTRAAPRGNTLRLQHDLVRVASDRGGPPDRVACARVTGASRPPPRRGRGRARPRPNQRWNIELEEELEEERDDDHEPERPAAAAGQQRGGAIAHPRVRIFGGRRP